MSKCIGCNQEFDKHEIQKHVKNCKLYKQKINEIKDKLTYDFLYNEYIIKEKSMKQIAKELGLSKPRLIEQAIKEHNIKIRSKSESRFAKGYIEQCKKTSQERYGKSYHTTKGSSIFDKISNAVKEKYNVDNVSQLPEIKEKISKSLNKLYKKNHKRFKKYKEKTGYDNPFSNPEVQEKIKETNKIKYQHEFATQNNKIKEKIKLTRRLRKVSGKSKLAERFFLELEKHLPNHELYFKPKTKEFYIRFNNDIVYHYDFVDITSKKIIEFCGNFWHANPKKYSADWFNPLIQLTAEQIWERDKQKERLAKQHGYELLQIWEDDVKYNIKKELQKCISFIR